MLFLVLSFEILIRILEGIIRLRRQNSFGGTVVVVVCLLLLLLLFCLSFVLRLVGWIDGLEAVDWSVVDVWPSIPWNRRKEWDSFRLTFVLVEAAKIKAIGRGKTRTREGASSLTRTVKVHHSRTSQLVGRVGSDDDEDNDNDDAVFPTPKPTQNVIRHLKPCQATYTSRNRKVSCPSLSYFTISTTTTTTGSGRSRVTIDIGIKSRFLSIHNF